MSFTLLGPKEVRERVLALNRSKFTTKCVVSLKIRDLKKRLTTWVWGARGKLCGKENFELSVSG